jgi:3-oxoacyl-[acyl-carrier-protein] synthase II
VAALAVAQGRVPPTAGLTVPDDECVANHVIGAARELRVRAALSNSFGFGGLDAVLAFAHSGFAPDLDEPSRARKVCVLGGATLVRDSILAAKDASVVLDPKPGPASGPLELDLTPHLDAARARRLGRAERLVVAAVGTALADAQLAPREQECPVGLIAAKASGNPDATARFLQRVRAKGPRFAPPADFPNLMLSALAGHAAIYHGLRGARQLRAQPSTCCSGESLGPYSPRLSRNGGWPPDSRRETRIPHTVLCSAPKARAALSSPLSTNGPAKSPWPCLPTPSRATVTA